MKEKINITQLARCQEECEKARSIAKAVEESPMSTEVSQSSISSLSLLSLLLQHVALCLVQAPTTCLPTTEVVALKKMLNMLETAILELAGLNFGLCEVGMGFLISMATLLLIWSAASLCIYCHVMSLSVPCICCIFHQLTK